jgi:hypothetical protein
MIASRVGNQFRPIDTRVNPSVTFRSYTEYLIKVKDIKNRKSSLVDDLRQIAVLAEKFTELRPKSQKSWIHLAEVLDREG